MRYSAAPAVRDISGNSQNLLHSDRRGMAPHFTPPFQMPLLIKGETAVKVGQMKLFKRGRFEKVTAHPLIEPRLVCSSAAFRLHVAARFAAHAVFLWSEYMSCSIYRCILVRASVGPKYDRWALHRIQ